MQSRNRLFICLSLTVVVVAIAWVWYVCAVHRATAQRELCLRNLGVLDAEIENLAFEKHAKDGDRLSAEDITKWFYPRAVPRCPSGAAYLCPTIGRFPICPVHGDLMRLAQGEILFSETWCSLPDIGIFVKDLVTNRQPYAELRVICMKRVSDSLRISRAPEGFNFAFETSSGHGIVKRIMDFCRTNKLTISEERSSPVFLSTNVRGDGAFSATVAISALVQIYSACADDRFHIQYQGSANAPLLLRSSRR